MPAEIPIIKQDHSQPNRSLGKDLILPILILAGLILVFLNVKHLPLDLSEKDGVVLRHLVKVVMTILLPLGLIQLLYKDKGDFGIYFPTYSQSFGLSFKAFSVVGPACITFLLVGVLGWSFDDWPGAILLTIAFSVAISFVPKATMTLPTRVGISTRNSRINRLVLLSLFSVLVAYFTLEQVPVFSKIFYYAFIVGFGEEVLFRGYIQSSLNRYFGKSFRIGKVSFGWGLIIAALCFGLSHALVTVPPTWPWAVWTFIMGLGLGFIREKDGSILAAVILHAMLDMPLAFMN